MKEQLITFDTAKLAKEKGFKEPTKKAWIEITNKESNFFGSNKCRDVNASKLFDYEYYAPTQSLLQKWLLEIKHINIELTFDDGKWFIYVGEFSFPDCSVELVDALECSNYTDAVKKKSKALEKGLQEALKLI